MSNQATSPRFALRISVTTVVGTAGILLVAALGIAFIAISFASVAA